MPVQPRWEFDRQLRPVLYHLGDVAPRPRSDRSDPVTGPVPDGPVTDVAPEGPVLLVCSANECRSVMAEAFLRTRLAGRVRPVTVMSAGFLSSGRPAPEAVQVVMRDAGIDVSGHRSRLVDGPLLARSALVVTMTRQQLVDLAVGPGDAWRRCFTLAEVLRRGSAAGSRHADESLPSWVARVGAGRTRSGLLTLDLSDDVADPTGRRPAAMLAARDRIRASTGLLGDMLSPGRPE